ncbi:UPF0061-domain-containing protein [Lepidopterella palustris CBS 459.81]|uniref:Selenoprotein O n=1 Tax=Lepidopterella palustris CBS 459.81 TaxID=1314670 RepID=A0A8E2E5P7_9PEZI|nr:UPF0061-domain-containing protein [Lepidopterella palustris CBS 459.81]
MASHLNSNSDTPTNGASAGFTFRDLPKSNNFTSNLPPDPAFPTPVDSHKAPREALGPRLVKGALYTYVRPEITHSPELLAVSERAMEDLGLKPGEEQTQEFKSVVAGNNIISWDDETEEGIYPWAQCYGGYQFGQWAGQLGDGRAISLFETINPATNTRYELQLKGAGKTPYSRFADGKAVLRSSIREFIVSEYLNAISIPTTRALSLTLCSRSRVQRERIEPGAIVARFSESWLRLGTFDLIRMRADRPLMRQLATYTAEHVYGGWDTLPSKLAPGDIKTTSLNTATNVSASTTEGSGPEAENRFVRLYREVCRRNAKTVAAWQAYGFMNGVLNTDNTSVLGLSIDFGPFAFLDSFDPTYTPNHDDHMLRYSYRNQPSVIWWNLVRFGEALGELMGAGAGVDEAEFVEKGVKQEAVKELVERAEAVIERTGEEYKAVFLAEYKRLMTARLGLKTHKEEDFESLFSEWLDLLEEHELDFHHAFRRLGRVALKDLETEGGRKDVAGLFFAKEPPMEEGAARGRIAAWLAKWGERVREDWGEARDQERMGEMMKVNPKFVPRSWILDEVIERVERKGERDILPGIMRMVLDPFRETWGWDGETEERFCGDVPKYKGMLQCSCSS